MKTSKTSFSMRFVRFFIFILAATVMVGLTGPMVESFRAVPTAANQNTASLPEKLEDFSHNASGAERTSDYKTALSQLGIVLHPGESYKLESKSGVQSATGAIIQQQHCAGLVYRTLKSLPAETVNHLKHLTLYFSDTGRRGLGGGNTIILRCQNVTDEELVGVLVHEMGHIRDTGVMQGTARSGESGFVDGKNVVYEDDPSVEFYRLSWSNSEDLKAEARKLDFVSGYAMSDPFEDFAESHAYYVLHGDEFRELARYNDILREKYDFLKDRVFAGAEFGDKRMNTREMNIFVRSYDTTVLPYDMESFLGVDKARVDET